jgi:hypothetical protein
MPKRTTRTTRYRVSEVLGELAVHGIATQRETVTMVSDQVLKLHTRASETGQRRWTPEQVTEVVIAFRLARLRGLTWDEVAEVLRGVGVHDVLADLDAHVERLSTRAAELEAQVDAFESLSEALRSRQDAQLSLPATA